MSTAFDQGLLPQTLLYYGAIAIAPDEGLANPRTTVAVGNFHDAESAGAAALARCNAARAEDSAECVVVLEIRPAGWEAGAALQLSSGAADALRSEFRRLSRPRVFAISDATGQYGMGPGIASARAACGVEDCRAVVLDD